MRRSGDGAAGHREWLAMLALWALAVFACILGLARPTEAQEALGQQALDLVRVLSTSALAIVLILGPGIVLRDLLGRRDVSLGFLPLPGVALLIAIGALAWLLASSIGSATTCFIVTMPILAALLAGLLRAGPEGLLEPEERVALLIASGLLGLAVARALWFFGPEGELFSGGITRTLEVGSRPDSRIPFHVTQLVTHGTHPYSELGESYFSPYNFSSRGPLAGIATAPVVLLAGGRPPAGIPELGWKPFDPSGFMAFRLAMMTLSCTALLSLWSLTDRIAGHRAARLAILLAATTPFLLHEAWFTWPKLLAASFALLAAVSLLEKRPLQAGILVGVGYLMHPVALLSLPALALLAAWPLVGADWRRPRLDYLAKLLLGTGAFFLAWRLANGSNYIQDSFLNYLTEAGPGIEAAPWSDPGAWLSHRLESLGNTVVPMMLALAHGDDPAINFFGGSSPPLIHIFFQTWNTLPFGVGIIFFPLLLVSLWRAWRRWRWGVTIAVVVPFLTFLVYWGSYTTGMLPEGLQTWVLTLLAVAAIQQGATGFGWLRSPIARGILSLRAVGLLAVALVPTLATRSEVISAQYPLTDTVALLGVIACSAGLAVTVWSTKADGEEGRQRSGGEDRVEDREKGSFGRLEEGRKDRQVEQSG
ncbi:MAG TPA: hypothetical protein VI039_02850 [Solirubrobacterales bacterium]